MDPVTLPEVAVMVAVPAVAPAVTNPVVLTVATLLFEELHVTELVTFCVLPFERVAVATSWSWLPGANETVPVWPLVSETLMLLTVLLLTVNVVDAL